MFFMFYLLEDLHQKRVQIFLVVLAESDERRLRNYSKINLDFKKVRGFEKNIC